MREAHKLKSLQAKPNIGVPCATVLTLLRALPGVLDLLVTVAREIITRGLSASPGAPGPHDLAVRYLPRSSHAPTTSIASRFQHS
jgi:hypothetical protein